MTPRGRFFLPHDETAQAKNFLFQRQISNTKKTHFNGPTFLLHDAFLNDAMLYMYFRCVL